MILDRSSAPAAVDDVLETWFEGRIARAATGGASYETLWRRVREATQGGKRVRPALVLLAHRLLGGTADDDALLAAAAVELLHTALVLHDDVLDGDLVRRNAPNLQGAFVADAIEAGVTAPRAAAWGETAGLLAGDLLLSAVHALVARIASPTRVEIHEIVDDSLLVTAGGELADVGFGLGTMQADPGSIGRMMADKTADYSFAAPLRIGAALAGADAATSAELGRIGTELGFVYQLRDDLLGVFGDRERLGKPTDGDLREGKRTLLVAFAESTPEWARVRHLFGRRTIEPEEVELLRSALVACGAADEASRLLTRRSDRLRARIEASTLPVALRAELVDIARGCGERDA